ncbi:MAG: hypothetical protein WCB04_09320 [Mycobacteriales bacterium]
MIALVVVSFFAHVPGGRRLAGLVLLVVLVQVTLGYASFDAPVLGLLHGVNAIILAIVAGNTARRAAPSHASVPA